MGGDQEKMSSMLSLLMRDMKVWSFDAVTENLKVTLTLPCHSNEFLPMATKDSVDWI